MLWGYSHPHSPSDADCAQLQSLAPPEHRGADSGNQTRICSLGSCQSVIDLCPQDNGCG